MQAASPFAPVSTFLPYSPIVHREGKSSSWPDRRQTEEAETEEEIVSTCSPEILKMPTDFFRWEEAGALVHHCPHCQQPLTNPRSRAKCLGHHVEWCRRYHTQLFKKGGSSSCMACRNSDEQSDQRHRNIAGLIRKLEETQSSPAVQSPKTPMLSRLNSSAASGSISKKDRKAAKKAAKAADRPKFVTAKEVKHVGDVLHPQEEDAEEFEKALLEDENISENLYYHSGTANTVEMRHSFIRQERSGKGELIVEKAEMDRIMTELKVPDASEVKDKQTRALITSIAKAVEEDLIHIHNEERLIMRRKSGFWRWASRKAYDRLCANNRIWDWKNGESTVPDKAEAAEPAVSEDLQPGEEVVQGDAMELDVSEEVNPAVNDVCSNSIDSIGTEISGEESSTSSNRRKNSVRSDASTDRTSIDSGVHDVWKTVGRPGKLSSTPKAKGPPMKLKLSLNGGLDRLITKPTPKTPKSSGFATWSDEKENENEGDDGDDECDVSPLTALCGKRFPRD